MRIFLFLILAAECTVSAQDRFMYDAGAEESFSRGISMFRQSDFAGATRVFDSLAARSPIHQKSTASYLMAAKARYRTGNYRESAESLARFFQKFPESSYADDARFTLALDDMMMGFYGDAASQLARVLEISRDAALRSKGAELFETLADRHLQIQELQQILRSVTTADARDLVLIKIAEKYSAAGDHPSATNAASMVRRDGPYRSRMEAIFQRLGSGAQLKIGVELPLMKGSPLNPLQSVAAEMLDGMNFAIGEGNLRLYLDVRDVERDSAKTVGATSELASDPDVLAIVGPLFSNLALIGAPVAERAGVPMISPTAAGNGIAAAGSHIFQISPDYTIRARAMARYAVRTLGFSSLAVLGSADGSGKILADSFVAEAKRLGATIVAAESYPKGVSDFREQFIAIRKAAFDLAASHDKPDDLDVPVKTIDGIFLPVGDAEEIGIIAPQVKFFNITTQILGTSDWNDPARLEEHKRYVNGVIFPADAYPQEDGSPFDGKFAAEMKRKPTKYTRFGYDTMKLILGELARGARSRAALAAALAEVEGYRGVHSRITLRGSRVNSEIIILKYLNGEFVNLAEMTVN